MNWVSAREGCGGVLSPDQDGLRQLYHIKDGRAIAWQKRKADLPTDVLVGRFVFDGAAFAEATGWLDDQLEDPNIKTLVLDEIGPLELSGGGWNSWLTKLLKNETSKTIILVVREGLVEKVVRHYGIEEYTLVTKAYFQDLGDR